MSLITKLLTMILCLGLILGFAGLAYAEEGESKGESAGESDSAEVNFDELLATELEQVKYITNRPTAYTKETFDAYAALAAPVQFLTMGGNELPEEMQGIVFGLAQAREALQLADGVTDPEETIWYIWGDQMAQAADADSYSFDGYWDNPGFRPFLVPYLLDDQSQVKGNIILISGGGYQQRANRWEGYPAAEAFNDLGYNCYVLQRRVEPFTPEDAALDLQRSIRYLRFHAEEYGIAQIDNLAAAGYSGGGSTINQCVEMFYGDVLPSSYYPEYQDDEIDAVNSDLANVILVYSAAPLETENPNIPNAFIINGIDDEYTDLYENSYKAIQYYREQGVRYEVHFFSDAGHGFGNGFGLNATTYVDQDVANVKVWPALADTFLQIQSGQLENITVLSEH